MQHDLFRNGPPDLDLKPVPGRSEPRLWVRRLIIWRDKGDVLRDIPLRPGLNVIWSPDAAADGTSIGHGGGKTTFCRLLRYCLGEDSFAPIGQRRATFDKMPNGRVGAEIRLDGRDWLVIRAFSAVNDDWAIPNATLDHAIEGITPTGMDPFRAAATGALLGDAIPLMPTSIGNSGAWPSVLAWMTRDQECRFSHLLDWRDTDSASKSPVAGRSVEDRLMIVRAVLGALTQDEISAEAARAGEAEQVKTLGAAIARLDWQIGREREVLRKALGLDAGLGPSELDAATLARAAAERLAAAVGLQKQESPTELPAAQAEQRRLEAIERSADIAVQTRATEIKERDRSIKQLKDELPQLSAAAATIPLCSICHAPLTGVHACDQVAQKEEYNRVHALYASEQKILGGLRAGEGGLRQNHAAALQNLKRQRKAVDQLIAIATSRSAELQRAQGLASDARRYEGLWAERTTTATEQERREAERDRLKELVDKHREGARDLLNQLSGRCDAVIRHLVPGEASGRAVLDGKGLHLHVQMGGDRSTAAIESLKVVIFDLAVLTFAIEGQTRFPGFLVHDSPREADLDLLVYHRLFEFVQLLERHGPVPQFQYIVTTTTAPPQQIIEGGLVSLELRGAPAVERLLKADL